MELRTKSDIIRDIDHNRELVLEHARPRRTTRLKKSLASSVTSTRQLASNAYSTGRQKLQELDHQLHVHTYGAASLALSVGTIAGVMTGKQLKAALSPRKKRARKGWF